MPTTSHSISKPQIFHLTNDSATGSEKFIGELKLKPYNQSRIPLGRFSVSHPPKGFSVEIAPDPNPTDSVTTQVMNTGDSRQYNLMLHASNNGTSTVTIRVYQLI